METASEFKDKFLSFLLFFHKQEPNVKCLLVWNSFQMLKTNLEHSHTQRFSHLHIPLIDLPCLLGWGPYNHKLSIICPPSLHPVFHCSGGLEAVGSEPLVHSCGGEEEYILIWARLAFKYTIYDCIWTICVGG